MAFILVVVIALITVGLLVYFSNTGIKIEKHKHAPLTEKVATSVPHEKIRKELSDMDVPPEKAWEIADRIGNYVNEQVKKQAETVRYEMKKIVDVKDMEIKKVKTEYESVTKNYQKLGKQKRQTETVVRHMAKGLVVVNDAGEVLFANPVAEKILGVKPQTLIGKPISKAQGGDHFITMVNEEGEEERSIASLTQDRETKDIIKESTAIIENESGQTKGMVSILTGSTQVKRTDEFKNEFVANISHEFRTPLICIQKSIMAVRDELKNSNLTEHQRNYFDIALRNAKRLETMVNDILDISKIQSGKMVLRPEIFPAQQLVRDVKNMFAVWGRDKHIEIAEDIAGDTLPIEADQERLTQVLINLVSNALKFTPRGGKITIEAKFIDEKSAKQPEDAGCLQVGVRDTGPGIPPDDLKKLFQKFTHASTVATEGEKGSGLGLTIAKEIVQLHNGRIWVESEVGKGTYFAFTVPRRPLATLAGNGGGPPTNLSSPPA